MSPSRTQSDPYELFSRVYDLPDHEEITRSFIAKAMPEFRARRSGTAVLDLACGTGRMADLLAKLKVPVVGVDRSREMLKIARERRVPRALWIEGDLRNFELLTDCSVATACGDVLNHFRSVAALRPVLRHVYQVLPEDGVFLFETTRKYCYEEYWDDRTYHLEGERGDVSMQCEWEPVREVATVRMVGYARNADETFDKFEVVLTEYFHDEDELEVALAETGFGGIRRELWSPWDDQHLEPEMDRVFWTVRKS